VAIYREERYEYDGNGTIVYRGASTFLGANDTNQYWDIWKFTWDASGNCERIQGPQTGSWGTRASMVW
jgi:hypothetical protein